MNVFGSFLHAHLAATQIITRHFRDGKELEVLDEDRHYDFNYQQYKLLEKPVKFRPVSSVFYMQLILQLPVFLVCSCYCSDQCFLYAAATVVTVVSYMQWYCSDQCFFVCSCYCSYQCFLYAAATAVTSVLYMQLLL